MDPVVAAAFVSGWASIIGGLIHLHVRTNGSGPLAAKLDDLKGDVCEIKADVKSLRNDFARHVADDRRHY